MVKTMTTIALVVMSITMLLFGLQLCLANKSLKTLTQASPLESGFEAIVLIDSAISSPFVFLAVIFVLFDLEIVFLFPLLSEVPNLMTYWETCLIFMFMILSLALEWKYSGLKWQI